MHPHRYYTFQIYIFCRSLKCGSDEHFQGDDFGESSLGLFSDVNIEEARERVSYAPEAGISRSAATLLEESEPGSERGDVIIKKPMDVDIADHLGMPMPDDDFGDFPADNMLDGKLFNRFIESS